MKTRIIIIFAIMLLLATLAAAQSQDIYMLTLSIKDGKAQVIKKELARGYVPQVYGGASITVKDSSGTLLYTGNFDLPSKVVMEKFFPDGRIEGDHLPFEGQLVVFAPAFEKGKEVELKDERGNALAKIDVTELKPKSTSGASETDPKLKEFAASSGFLIKYAWVFLLIAIIIAIGLVIYAIIRLIRKLRKKEV